MAFANFVLKKVFFLIGRMDFRIQYDMFYHKQTHAVNNIIRNTNPNPSTQMLQSWPAIIYVFFAGALSDRFGRKWLICLPVIGVFVSTVFQLIHYMFIR